MHCSWVVSVASTSSRLLANWAGNWQRQWYDLLSSAFRSIQIKLSCLRSGNSHPTMAYHQPHQTFSPNKCVALRLAAQFAVSTWHSTIMLQAGSTCSSTTCLLSCVHWRARRRHLLVLMLPTKTIHYSWDFGSKSVKHLSPTALKTEYKMVWNVAFVKLETPNLTSNEDTLWLFTVGSVVGHTRPFLMPGACLHGCPAPQPQFSSSSFNICGCGPVWPAHQPVQLLQSYL